MKIGQERKIRITWFVLSVILRNLKIAVANRDTYFSFPPKYQTRCEKNAEIRQR